MCTVRTVCRVQCVLEQYRKSLEDCYFIPQIIYCVVCVCVCVRVFVCLRGHAN